MCHTHFNFSLRGDGDRGGNGGLHMWLEPRMMPFKSSLDSAQCAAREKGAVGEGYSYKQR